MRRFNFTALAAIGLCIVGARNASAQNADGWKPVAGHIITRWAKDVSPDKAWPEYPRPTMTRERWLNLNGVWMVAITAATADRPSDFTKRVLVPFPLESALSGLGRPLEPTERAWYRRMVMIPPEWKGQRVLLHFGASDWETMVQVNGKPLDRHRGGYDPFTVDITASLKEGENELIVGVTDPTDSLGQPRGKQVREPNGIWYTRTSGIWQTVWLEPVPQFSIAQLRITPSFKEGVVRVKVAATGATGRFNAKVRAFDGQREVASAEGKTGADIVVTIPKPHAWSPSDPFLYNLSVSISENGAQLDEVKSYFGMRDIRVAKDSAGINRLMLNGEPVFQFGPLDQGFWPDGLYTPPTDEAMKFDIEAVKKMGGNMLRKHVKVECERFYTWCDKLGVLVWQDMPSGDNPPIARKQFEDELQALISSRYNHPSIVMWVPFNEGWGQHDTEKVVELVKAADPSRLVNNASGWTDKHVGDVADLHSYPGPSMLPVEEKRASVLGEFGGLGLPVDGHTWIQKNNWGYVSYKNAKDLTDAYVALMEQLPPLISQGLCAAVYTQTTDVEVEVNGWLTYDREVWKVDPARASEAMKAVAGPPPKVTVIVPRVGQAPPATWKYTTAKPSDGWEKSTFNDGAWTEGPAGFGTKGTPGATVGTEWSTNDLWIRRKVTMPSAPATHPYLSIHHDEDCEVYINGELAASLKGYTTGYSLVKLSESAAKLLKPGANVIAAHCHQTGGGQYLDIGFCDVSPAGPATKSAPAGAAAPGAPDGKSLAETLDAGRLFGAYCSMCHGANLEGALYSSLIDGKWNYAKDDAGIATAIKDGLPNKGMASFAKQLNPDQINALVAFIRDKERAKLGGK